jgi:CheY-like chemotaxis protein
MNLATNAAHAMKSRGGVLEVRMSPVIVDPAFAERHQGMHPGLHAKLSLSDSGTGIPDDVRQRIFEPFFTTKPQGEGTGLGLSVISQIVRSLDGAIEVTTRLGEGTRFDVYLPAAPSPGVPDGRHRTAGDSVRRLLLVEDEARLAVLGQRVLESAGYDVTVHTSSLQALEEFSANPTRFDLLITDNTMPHMTGLQMVEKILYLRPGLPVLMVSGIGETMPVEALKERGVGRLLSKPYQSNDLKTAVRELLEAASLADALPPV